MVSKAEIFTLWPFTDNVCHLCVWPIPFRSWVSEFGKLICKNTNLYWRSRDEDLGY